MPEELRLFDADVTAQLLLHQGRNSTDEALRRVAETANEVAQASERLCRAVVKARQAGYSWRRIGEVSGVPYQSCTANLREVRWPERLTIAGATRRDTSCGRLPSRS